SQSRRPRQQSARPRLLEPQRQNARDALQALSRRPVKNRARALSLLVAIALVIAGGAVFMVRVILRSHHATVPPELVPPEWEQFKTSAGHRKHVDEQGLACKECHDYEKVGF